eukprot:6193171-Pleurochrysis_carterae.AAC.2
MNCLHSSPRYALKDSSVASLSLQLLQSHLAAAASLRRGSFPPFWTRANPFLPRAFARNPRPTRFAPNPESPSSLRKSRMSASLRLATAIFTSASPEASVAFI